MVKLDRTEGQSECYILRAAEFYIACSAMSKIRLNLRVVRFTLLVVLDVLTKFVYPAIVHRSPEINNDTAAMEISGLLNTEIFFYEGLIFF